MTSRYSNVEDDAYSLKHVSIFGHRFLRDTIAEITCGTGDVFSFKVSSELKDLKKILERNHEHIINDTSTEFIYKHKPVRPLNKDYYSCSRQLLSSRTSLTSKNTSLDIDCIEPKYLYKIICDYYGLNNNDNTFYKSSISYLHKTCIKLDVLECDLFNTYSNFYIEQFHKAFQSYEQQCFRQHKGLVNWHYRNLDARTLDTISKFNISKKHSYLLRDELDIMFLLSSYGLSNKYKYIENCNTTVFSKYLLGEYNYKFMNEIGSIFPELSKYRNVYVLVIPIMNHSNPTIEYHVFYKKSFCCVLRLSLYSRVKFMVYDDNALTRMIKRNYIVDDATCQIIDEVDISSREKLKDYYRNLGNNCDYFYFFRR